MMETLLLVAQHRNRTFQPGLGILPNPLLACTTTVANRTRSYPSSPKTPSPSVYPHHSVEYEHLNRFAKSGTIPISVNVKADHNKEGFNIELSYSELWAGPAYSNSPPPSSLPIPKFSLPPKRSVSLNLPSSASDINFHHIAKSAPPSPTRDRMSSFSRDLFHSYDSATKTLCRILNLDIEDE